MNINFNKKPYVTNHILSGSSLANFLRLLADNKYDVERKYWPKLVKSFLIILLSFPNFLLEKLLFNSKIRKTNVKSPVFILGYPRSGTTYLMYLLSLDKQFAFCRTYECLGPHVIFTFGRVLRFIAKIAMPAIRPMDNMPLGATLPKEEEFAVGNMGVESMTNALYFPKNFSNYFNRFVLFQGKPKEKLNWKRNHLFLLKKLTLKNRGKQLLLKSPFDTGRIKEILELYPDAKFIHIYRHPFAVYSSNEKLYESVLPQIAFHKVSNSIMEQHVLYTYKAMYQKYFADKLFIPPKNLIEFSYEQFIGNEPDLLKHVYAQLGLNGFGIMEPIYMEELKRNSQYQTNKYRLNSKQELQVYERWKFAFDAFGYNNTL